MARKYHQGLFQPKNPEKYRGDSKNIVFRSSWELNYFRKLDTNPNIIQWGSEEVVIPYISPLDGEYHRYFMDIWMKYRDRNGEIKQGLIEIKPYDQTQPPKKQKRKTKQYIEKVKTYAVNKAKWDATKKFCQKNKLKFAIMTEKGPINY